MKTITVHVPGNFNEIVRVDVRDNYQGWKIGCKFLSANTQPAALDCTNLQSGVSKNIKYDFVEPIVWSEEETTPYLIPIPDDCEIVNKTELMRLRDNFRVRIQCGRDEVWYWQGDGGDVPESLGCPVVMSADNLRAMLAADSAPVK